MVDARPFLDGLVDEVKRKGMLGSPDVERALRSVERHRFLGAVYERRANSRAPGDLVPIDPVSPTAAQLRLAYTDDALVTKVDGRAGTSSSSQPSLMANMLELLELAPGMRVLEIGAGTGYNAALVSEIVGADGWVTTLDIQSDIAQQARTNLRATGYGQVEVLERDGFYGASERAPYDRIVATVGCTDLSPHWIAQLESGGFALVPLLHGGLHPLVRARIDDGEIRGRVVGWSGFMPIQGELAQEQEPGRPGRRKKVLSLERFDRAGLASFRFFASISEQQIALGSIHDEWNAAGRPREYDFAMRFVPLGEVSAPARWKIDRVLYQQQLWLSPVEAPVIDCPPES